MSTDRRNRKNKMADIGFAKTKSKPYGRSAESTTSSFFLREKDDPIKKCDSIFNNAGVWLPQRRR
jgi:hypothetical protein